MHLGTYPPPSQSSSHWGLIPGGPERLPLPLARAREAVTRRRVAHPVDAVLVMGLVAASGVKGHYGSAALALRGPLPRLGQRKGQHARPRFTTNPCRAPNHTFCVRSLQRAPGRGTVRPPSEQ